MTQNDSVLIGVTGGVGAGKSFVLGLLAESGVRILLLDEVGHAVMDPGGTAYAAVLKLFGDKIKKPDGSPDRARIAEIIRNNPEKAEELNRIVHPAVREDADKWIRRFREGEGLHFANENAIEKKPRLAAIESAILLEAGYGEICDEVWYIYADEAVRRKRLRESRGWNMARIDATIRAQKSESEFAAAAKVVIDNSGTPEETRRQVMREISRLMNGRIHS